MNKSAPQKDYFLALDSFRGICACMVVFSHFHANSIFEKSKFFLSGSIWVDFFFVLSGFVIAANYMQKLQNGFPIRKFMFLRLGRLYPLHITVLGAYLLIDGLQVMIPIEGASVYAPFSAPGETPFAIFANVLMIHSLNVLDILSFNGPSWSISVELYAYLLFALLFSYSKNHLKFTMAFIMLASFAILFMNREHLYAKLDLGYFRCVYGFGAGVFTWILYMQHKEKILSMLNSSKIKNIIEISVLLLVLGYIYYLSSGITSFVAPLVLSVIIFTFAFEQGIISRLIKNKFFLLLGTLSYSIYMIHMIIIGKLFDFPMRMIEKHFDITFRTVIGEKELYGTNIYTGTIMELSFVALVIICSMITYKLIEEPFRKMSKRIANK